MSPTYPVRQDVVAAVICRAGRFLVAERPMNKHFGGHWEFPGGKREPNETIEQAVIREIREELDVPVTGVGRELFSISASENPLVIRFMSVEVRGEPRAIEHSGLLWASVDELSLLMLAPADREFFRVVLKDGLDVR